MIFHGRGNDFDLMELCRDGETTSKTAAGVSLGELLLDHVGVSTDGSVASPAKVQHIIMATHVLERFSVWWGASVHAQMKIGMAGIRAILIRPSLPDTVQSYALLFLKEILRQYALRKRTIRDTHNLQPLIIPSVAARAWREQSEVTLDEDGQHARRQSFLGHQIQKHRTLWDTVDVATAELRGEVDDLRSIVVALQQTLAAGSAPAGGAQGRAPALPSAQPGPATPGPSAARLAAEAAMPRIRAHRFFAQVKVPAALIQVGCPPHVCPAYAARALGICSVSGEMQEAFCGSGVKTKHGRNRTNWTQCPHGAHEHEVVASA